MSLTADARTRHSSSHARLSLFVLARLSMFIHVCVLSAMRIDFTQTQSNAKCAYKDLHVFQFRVARCLLLFLSALHLSVMSMHACVSGSRLV